MSMENFAPEFRTPEQYIVDITYRIWEERGVGRIYDWYAPDCPVRSPHSVSNSAETVVANTLSSLTAFPNRDLLAEDVIIGDEPSGFYSSHRVRSVGVHLGDGSYWGPATGRRVTALAIADCLCRDNRVVQEWVAGDDARVALQLGLDPVAFGKANGRRYPEAYAVGSEALRRRWSAPEGLTILGDTTIANRLIDTYAAIWDGKNLDVLPDRYDRAVRFEGPSGHLSYGRAGAGNVFTGILASIPDGRFEPHHVIVRQQPERAVRVALRWSYAGSHKGDGRYGEATGCPLTVLGISHFELRDGLIAAEWLIMDDTAIYAQIAAHQPDARQPA